MERRHLLYITAILFILGAITPVIIYWLSPRPNLSESKFRRKLYEEALQPIKIIPRDKQIYLIAGVTSSHIYFGSLLPGHYVETSLTLSDSREDSLTGPNFPKRHIPYQLFIDSPNIFLCVGNFRKIYKSNLNRGNVVDSISTYYSFTRACMVSTHEFVLRAVDTSRPPDQIFVKVDLRTGQLKREKELSERNGDAGISTDGQLVYDNFTKQLFYCPFYNGRLLGLDSSLERENVFTTIDVPGKSKMKAGLTSLSFAKESKYTNLSPRYYVNRYSYAYNGNLWIASEIKTANQSISGFTTQTTIDVYDAKQIIYKYSFYIPKIDGERVSQFQIVNHSIIALYKTNIAAFALPKFTD